MEGRRHDHFQFQVAVVGAAAALLLSTVALPCLSQSQDGYYYCLSWRLAVETGNLRAWATVPPQCVPQVECYMVGTRQYRRDLKVVADLASAYLGAVAPAGEDGLDAWVLDLDDTCLSNLAYYAGKRFGGDPFDRVQFEAWAKRSLCNAIPEVLGLFRKLVDGGFKVFILTGRDEGTLLQPTVDNLRFQGFAGYERLIMRGPEYRGRSAVIFKSDARRRLVSEGYRIRGNVGDQWSDLQGDCTGDRNFKIPNPMYFVP